MPFFSPLASAFAGPLSLARTSLMAAGHATANNNAAAVARLVATAPAARFLSVRMIPIKKQVTPTSMWSQKLDRDPSLLNPAAFIPEKTLEQVAIPYTASANGPLPPTPYPDLGSPASAIPKNLKKTLVSMRRTVKVTKGGKVVSMSALVVVGDGNGSVGYGEGKDAEAPRAVRKATAAAIKNMIAVDRYDERTVLHDLDCKFKATHIVMRAAPPGFGIRTNPNVHEVCRCAGISDLSAKVMGSRNPINVVKATFLALQKQKTATDLARDRGLRVHDVRKLVYGQ